MISQNLMKINPKPILFRISFIIINLNKYIISNDIKVIIWNRIKQINFNLLESYAGIKKLLVHDRILFIKIYHYQQ